MLQPHLGRLNAGNWLTDCRRTESWYRQRVFTPPRFVKYEGRTHYLRSEIERVIRELAVFVYLPLARVGQKVRHRLRHEQSAEKCSSPDPASITPNTPLRLAVAASIAYPDGSINASGLRRE